VFWAALAHFCATECATAGILCNSTACGFELIDATALRLGIPAQHAAALHQLKVKKLLAVLRTKLA
jgi:hypothetical protein